MNQSPYLMQEQEKQASFIKKKSISNKGQDKEHTGEIILNDYDAIVLFVCFYKIMFLGTKFSAKMLKLQLQQDNEGQQKRIYIEDKSSMTDEEGKASDFGFDMSDIISSDCN